MASMSNVLGLVFANMHDNTVPELTKARTMASIPVGARYRLIDFPLSNMVNSGVDEVGVITKSNYQSLMDHIGMGGEWDLSRKTGGLHVLPPYGQVGGGIYRGRLEALAGVQDFIRKSTAEYVILTDSDVIANVDYKPIVEAHKKNGADITCVYGRDVFTMEQTRNKTILCINENNAVYDVLLRPEMSGELNVSLNMFVMDKKFLESLIKETSSRNQYSFEVDVLQHRLHDFKFVGYKYNGYFKQIDSMMCFYKANMALMDRKTNAALFPSDTPIYTKIRDEAPAKYGIDAKVKHSLIADGCIIEGTVENSVLFRGVKVAKGAVVKNCVIMQGAIIGEKAEIHNAITDKDVVVTKYRSIIGSTNYPVFVNKGAVV